MGSISLRARTYERVKELALRADLWIQRVNFVQHFRAGECSWALGWLISDLARWERDGKGGWRRVRPQPARVGAAR